MIYRKEDWPHGLRCPDCDHLFVEGERYSRRLDGFQEDSPVLEIVCFDCCLGVTA